MCVFMHTFTEREREGEREREQKTITENVPAAAPEGPEPVSKQIQPELKGENHRKEHVDILKVSVHLCATLWVNLQLHGREDEV